MKIKETRKSIMNRYRCVAIGYCDAYYLLHGFYPTYYTSGVYGWNADVYIINGVAIVTGYRPFGTKLSYGLVDRLNHQAKKAVEADDLEALEEIRTEFLNICIKVAR